MAELQKIAENNRRAESLVDSIKEEVITYINRKQKNYTIWILF